jgi:hypothetical protein
MGAAGRGGYPTAGLGLFMALILPFSRSAVDAGATPEPTPSFMRTATALAPGPECGAVNGARGVHTVEAKEGLGCKDG